MTAPPLKNKRQINCLNKRRYPDEFSARAGAMHAVGTYRRVEELHVYKCVICGGWHLTRQVQHGAGVTADDPVFDRRKKR